MGVASKVSDIVKLGTTYKPSDYFRVGSDFDFGGERAHAGDIIIALNEITYGINNSTLTPSDWNIIHTNVSIDNVVDLTSDQEISGNKTFIAPIKINTETVATQEWVIKYIQDNFATLMSQYLNSVEAIENKPTEVEISTIFNEEEEV